MSAMLDSHQRAGNPLEETTVIVVAGAKVVGHGRYATFQLAEVAVPSTLFREILRRIDDPRPRPAPV